MNQLRAGLVLLMAVLPGGETMDMTSHHKATVVQTIVGFGGSFTESSSHVLKQLSAGKRHSVINAYFGKRTASPASWRPRSRIPTGASSSSCSTRATNFSSARYD